MRILLMRRKDVREILPDHRLDVACDLVKIFNVPSIDQRTPSIAAGEVSGQMGMELVPADPGLETAGHDVNSGRQLACPKTHVLHAIWLVAPRASTIERSRALSQARTRRRLWPTAVRMTFAASPSRSLKWQRPRWPSVFTCPITGSIAERRRVRARGAPALRKPPSPALDPERAWETTERS